MISLKIDQPHNLNFDGSIALRNNNYYLLFAFENKHMATYQELDAKTAKNPVCPIRILRTPLEARALRG